MPEFIKSFEETLMRRARLRSNEYIARECADGRIWRKTNGGVAQLGEHLPCKQGVMSSNLTISIMIMKKISRSLSVKIFLSDDCTLKTEY